VFICCELLAFVVLGLGATFVGLVGDVGLYLIGFAFAYGSVLFQ